MLICNHFSAAEKLLLLLPEQSGRRHAGRCNGPIWELALLITSSHTSIGKRQRPKSGMDAWKAGTLGILLVWAS
jgi:hypothetical protein